MKANETKFQPIIEGTKQYIVPLFQRAYSWEKREWGQLWDDLVDLCESSQPKTHFIGSIVTMPIPSGPEGVAKYLLIDGQQRLTTIFVLLALLRNLAREDDQSTLAEEINQTMMVNPFKKGDEYYKLVPTQADRLSFRRLTNQEPLDGGCQLAKCYQFYERKLRQAQVSIPVLNRAISSRLSVVSIVLEWDDNPHLVFESLNAKGRPLTQSDLIRNYFFMRIPVEHQEEIHARYWEPMQAALSDSLTECIRHYLMRNGDVVRQGEVYSTLKDRVEGGDALEALRELSVFAGYYAKLLEPGKETNPEIRSALVRLNRLEVTTAYPFLLNCYDDYSEGRLTSQDFVGILSCIENFVIRRFVCNVPTNILNKLFPALYAQAKLEDPSNLVDGVRLVLHARGYPRDAEFRTRLVESKLYGGGDRGRKTKLILESMEMSFGHKEQVPFDGLTVEHIMPQSPSEWWQKHLGEDWLADHELCLHTIGNLTLTAYNPELSNEPFPRKQERLSQSHLELNRYFEGLEQWTRTEIEDRSKALARLALEVWPYFGEEDAVPAGGAELVTGKKPRVLAILGQRMPVESWRDVLTQTMSTIADLEPEWFEDLAKEFPRFIGLEPGRFRRHYQLKNGYYLEINLSARNIYRFCTQAIESMGLSEEDWAVETD